jgi:hypothetical protein
VLAITTRPVADMREEDVDLTSCVQFSLLNYACE